MSVFRSLKHIYVQIVDDENGKTLAAASTNDQQLKKEVGYGGNCEAAKAVGKAIAMEMVLNNRTLSAQEALQYGLINRVASVEDYLAEALQLAAEIAARAPLAVQFGKAAVNKAFELSLSEGLEVERSAFYTLFATDDQKEGMAAFIEKRKPEWKGE